MIWWPFNLTSILAMAWEQGRNSPMIWWPFNLIRGFASYDIAQVVTHQWSGDPSIYLAEDLPPEGKVVTHQWSGDPSILGFARL